MGKRKKVVWHAIRGMRGIIYTIYTCCIGYAIHTINARHTIEKRVPGRHFGVLYFPIEKGSPEDTLVRFTPHRKRVPGRHFDMVYRHTVKMEKQGDTMRQKEQFYCVS